MTYFEKRARKIEKAGYESSKRCEKRILKLFKESLEDVTAKVDKIYREYAKDNKISISDAYKKLNSSELKKFRNDMKGYAKLIADENRIKELLTLSKRQSLTRLESIQGQIKAEVDLLSTKQLNLFTETLGEVYVESYKQSIYTVQNQTGIYYNYATVDKELLSKVLKYKDHGENFSERIWTTHRKKLFTDVQTQVAQSFAVGKSVKELVRDISKRYEVSYRNSMRLVRTEANFYSNQATKDAFEECSIEQYQYLATLDSRTTDVCIELDTKVFNLSEAIVGINYPPMLPNCRSTVMPFFEEATYKTRIAKVEGKNAIVEFMSYEEWDRKFN